MPDAYANSTALLEQLLRRVMKETDPVKYDRLAAEIRQVLEECQIFRGSDRVGPTSPQSPWYSSPCGRGNQIHPACRHLNQEVCRTPSNRVGVGLAHFNASL